MLKSSQKDFIKRHIGPSKADQQKMLKELGFDSLDENTDEPIGWQGHIIFGMPLN